MVLRYLLRNWLHTAVKQKVREKVVEAAREQLHTAADKAQTDQSEQQPKPCHLGVVFALGIEAGGLEDLLTDVVTTRGRGFVVRQGALKDRQVALILSGAGRPAAAKATEALITGHRPGWVLAAGLAGGLNPKLHRGDILLADHLVDTAGNQLALDLKLDLAALCRTPGAHVGRLLTADSVVRRPDEKCPLGRLHDAMAVDMESFAVAEVCRRHQVRFLAVRVINDAVDDELPPDVENLLAQKTGPARLGAAVGAVWRRPASFKDIYQLKENALLCSDRLGKFLARLIEQL